MTAGLISLGIPATMLRAGAVNAVLRIATMASKLLLVVYIGRYLTVSDMAVYGLVTTSVSMAVTLLGLEFYAFSTREILAATPSGRAVMLRDQLAFYAVGYLLLLPLGLPLFYTGVLPWSLAWAFYALAILEHLAQEVARLFNTLFRPVLSTVLFFVRSAAWGYAVIAVGLLQPSWNTVGHVLAAWIVGVGLSLLMAARELWRLDWSQARRARVDWAWVRRGLLIAAPFMVSALSYRVIELANRYIIHFMLTDIDVGVYSFYGGLANMIPAVVGAGITAILVPRIIDAWQAGRLDDYRHYFKTMSISATATSLAAVPAGFVAIMWLQTFTGKPEYAAHLQTCFVLLLSTAVGVIAQLPGVSLYARKEDMALLVAVVIGAVVNVVLNVVLIPGLGILGAAWATTLSYAAMGAYQLYRVRTAVDPAAA